MMNKQNVENIKTVNSVSAEKRADDRNSSFLGSLNVTFGDGEEMDLNELFLILFRRRKAILGIAALSTVLMVVFLVFQTPRYTAQTVMQINVRSKKVVDIESVMSGLSSDESAIASEMDVLGSRDLVGLVVEELGLVYNKEFNPNSSRESFLSKIKSWFSDPEEVIDEKQKRIERSQTIDNVMKRLDIVRSPRSYTIKVKFTSEDPELAAKFSNALSDEYLDNQLKLKFDATQRANEWLSSKITDLRKKLKESELAVQVYSEKNNLIESAGVTINDQQLSELNSQLILAKTELAQAEARLRSTKNSSRRGIDASSDVINSKLIQNLKEQETEVLRKKSDLSSKYGSKHPKIINVNAEQRDLREKIKLEINKIISSLENEVEISRTRVKTLEGSLEKLEKKSGVSNRAKVQLAELKREMEANRALYESFLTRFKETTEGYGFEQADANIISRAEIPLKTSYPKKKLFLFLALMFGVAIGIAIAFIIELLDNAFRSTHQLEALTHIPSVGMVPEVKRYKSLPNYVVKKPTSVFAESLRSINTSIHFSNPDKAQKTFMVTSSIPKEGKSSFASSLACLTAKSGEKVLLVDCDLRKPTISNILGVETGNTLVDYLEGKVELSKIIYKEEKSGLHYISAPSNTKNSQELLSSKKMKDLVGKLSEEYDYVIFDTPPIMAVSDSVIISKLVDACIFVVRWEKTPRKLVLSAIKQLSACKVPIVGTVLTRVDLAKHSAYGYGDSGYYYSRYNDYYTS